MYTSSKLIEERAGFFEIWPKSESFPGIFLNELSITDRQNVWWVSMQEVLRGEGIEFEGHIINDVM